MTTVRLVSSALLTALAVSSGCLSSYAPNIDAELHHGDLTPRASAEECMSCHQPVASWAQAHVMMATDPPSPTTTANPHRENAPLVMGWMLEDQRGCLHCHHLDGVP